MRIANRCSASHLRPVLTSRVVVLLAIVGSLVVVVFVVAPTLLRDSQNGVDFDLSRLAATTYVD